MQLSNTFQQSIQDSVSVKVLNSFLHKEVNLQTMCELRDRLPHLKVDLWEEGCRIIPEWKYHFKDDIHNFIDEFELNDHFLHDLIDAMNWVCALNKEQIDIMEDFVETLEIHSNYIAGAVSMIDFKNEIMLLRNVIIRFHDEHKTWYHANDNMLKVLYEAIREYTSDGYEEFMNRELDDFMRDHVWNKLVQLLAWHLKTEFPDNYLHYMENIKSLTGKSVEKLYQLQELIKSFPVANTVMIDGQEVSCIIEVVWSAIDVSLKRDYLI